MATSLVTTLPVADAFEREYLEYHGVLPLELRDGSIVVALHGDPDFEVLKDIEVTYGASLHPLSVDRETLLSAIHQAYAGNETVVELVRDLTSEFSVASVADESLTDARSQANQPPVIRFVNLLLREAHEAGASDIHVEATRDGMRLRLRIDGILVELPAPPRSLQAAIVSRLKLLAELDIAERRLPQDGRIRVRLDSRELDLRVSTVASMYGESIVLRLLDRGGRPVTLTDLGMSRELLGDFQRLVSRPHGIILATGPTGSGKTTTLYAALGLRHPDSEKVITIEDPVEYHLPGVSQIPVNEKAGVRFATALRSILRQDPDVLMVGEMRDSETAGIAIQAAMTGHLVLSTVHTNDAPSALTRLVDLKVEPYMVAATVEGILAQRLVRRICPECQVRYEPEPEMIELLSDGSCRVEERQFMRGRGCHSCRQTGYRGRAGLFELLIINEDLRRQLVDTPDASRLRAAATAQGMRTLREDGWAKVLGGITTIEEVLRVVQS